MKAHAVLLAGGAGRRLQQTTAKQYLTIGGRSLIEHALQRFSDAARISSIVLVVPHEQVETDRARLIPHFPKLVRVVSGGGRRQDSMATGCEALTPRDDDVVAVHDVARPFVAPAVIDECVRSAAVHGACIVAQPARDTIKRATAEQTILETIPRETVWQAQTPQAARWSWLREAMADVLRRGLNVTDEASMLEAVGHPVRLIPGSGWNLKITTSEDLVVAEAIWAAWSRNERGA